jgi:predicted transcriptional regulator
MTVKNPSIETDAKTSLDLQLLDIKEGTAEADRGDFASEAEVNALFAQYLT